MASTNPSSSQPDPRTRDLLVSAADGNEQAWEVLYRRYRMMLLTEARLQLRKQTRQRVDAEDLVQSAFFSAWDHIRSFEYRGEGSFRRWLANIVVNRARDRARRASSEDERLKQRGRDSEQRGSKPHEPTVEQPENALAKLEEEQRILAALENLPDDEREVILLKNFENKTWPEVAEVAGVSERTARRTYDGAVRHLARSLGARRDGE